MIAILISGLVIFIAVVFLFIYILGYTTLFIALLAAGAFYIVGYGSMILAIAFWLAGMFFFGQENILLVSAITLIIFLIIFLSLCNLTFRKIVRYVHAKKIE